MKLTQLEPAVTEIGGRVLTAIWDAVPPDRRAELGHALRVAVVEGLVAAWERRVRPRDGLLPEGLGGDRAS
jgi:hypothetical protein